MPTLRLYCLTSAIVLSLGACHEESSPSVGRPSDAATDSRVSDAESTPLLLESFEAFCDRFASDRCNHLADCCGLPTAAHDFCKTYVRATAQRGSVLAYCASPQVAPVNARVDLVAAARCVQESDRTFRGCEEDRLDDPRRDAAEASCGAIIDDTWPSTSYCYAGHESRRCQSPEGTYSLCVVCTDGCQPHCSKPAPLVSKGQRCSYTTECEGGLVCRRIDRSSNSSCLALAEDGAYCAHDDECGSGTCDLAGTYADGTCVRPAGLMPACPAMQVVADDALYATRATAERWWVMGAKIYWIDGTTLLSANADGSSERPETILSSLAPQNGWFELDDTQLVAFAPMGEAVVHTLSSGLQRPLTLPFTPFVSHLSDDALWIASRGCGSIARVALADGSTRSWFRVDDPTANSDLALLVRGGVPFCSSKNTIWRASSTDGGIVEHVRLPDADGAPIAIRTLVSAGDQTFAFTEGMAGAHQLYRIGLTDSVVAELPITSPTYDALLDGALFDPGTERFYGFLSGELYSYAPFDDAPSRQFVTPRIDDMLMDDSNLYWIGSGLVFRRAKF